MRWVPITIVLCGSAIVWIGSRIVWRYRTYETALAREVSRRGGVLIHVTRPTRDRNCPWTTLHARPGSVAEILGVTLMHFEYRLVTYKDEHSEEHTRWVRLSVSPLGVEDIDWHGVDVPKGSVGDL